MKAQSLINHLFESDPNDRLKAMGIVRRSPALPKPPTPTHNYDDPDDEAKLAIKGDLLNDLPEGPDFESMDGQDLLNAWQDACLEGQRIRYNNIDELFNVLGYDGLDEFFADNEGAVEAIQDFVLTYLEQSKKYGGENGWWGRMVQAIEDAKEN